MSKAEQFIKDCTRSCSNELFFEEGYINLYQPWLTPEQALRAVEIAKEEMIDTLEVKEVNLEIEQRMKECPYRQVGCTMYEDKVLECRGACSWVVDYPKLKKLKAQKGG